MIFLISVMAVAAKEQQCAADYTSIPNRIPAALKCWSLKLTTKKNFIWEPMGFIIFRQDFLVFTDIPVVGVGLHLHLADDVPDAGHPVGQEGEHRHEQGQDHRAVLRVAVHLLQEPQQTKQTDGF